MGTKCGLQLAPRIGSQGNVVHLLEGRQHVHREQGGRRDIEALCGPVA